MDSEEFSRNNPYLDHGAPTFPEPWTASAFALSVHLRERGLFDQSEWAEALSVELKKPGRRSDGSDFYEAWVDALTILLTTKGIGTEADILELQAAWKFAAEATPHGMPIRLPDEGCEEIVTCRTFGKRS
jgi:nitrile hydratase accessory protein